MSIPILNVLTVHLSLLTAQCLNNDDVQMTPIGASRPFSNQRVQNVKLKYLVAKGGVSGAAIRIVSPSLPAKINQALLIEDF